MVKKKEYCGPDRRNEAVPDHSFILGRMTNATEKMGEDVSNIYTELTHLGKKVARLEVKSSLWGAVGGALISIPAIGYMYLKLRGGH